MEEARGDAGLIRGVTVYEGRARVLPPEDEERARRILFESYSFGIRLYESAADRLPLEMAYVEISPVGEQEAAG